MASGEFTPQLCEALYKTPKYAVSRIEWRPKSTDGNTFLFRAKVLTEDGIGLDLCGHWQKVSRHGQRRWGFALRYLGNLVRSYDMANKHKNPGEAGWVRGPHKHKYSSSKIDRYAYKPNPPISEDDPNQALMDFLEESNIRLNIPYNDYIFA